MQNEEGKADFRRRWPAHRARHRQTRRVAKMTYLTGPIGCFRSPSSTTVRIAHRGQMPSTSFVVRLIECALTRLQALRLPYESAFVLQEQRLVSVRSLRPTKIAGAPQRCSVHRSVSESCFCAQMSSKVVAGSAPRRASLWNPLLYEDP
jgi:hypothetical protein